MGELDRFAFLENTAGKVAPLDANLLILRLSALTDPGLLKTFKRINQFQFEDVLLLEWMLGQFKMIVTTAYVLAEASNLGNSLHGETRNAWFLQLASYALFTEERHVSTNLLGELTETIRFGVADSALAHLSTSVVVITTERPLSGYLQSQNRNVLNFFDVKAATSNLCG